MDMTKFELVTPESLLCSQDVGMVVVPANEGNMGVLPRQAPTIATLRDGEICLYDKGLAGGISKRFSVKGGFVEVTPTRCVVLCEQAEEITA